MPVTTASLPAVQTLQSAAFTGENGQISPTAFRFMLDLVGSLSVLLTAVNTAVGVNSFTLAGQPALGVADVGFLGFVTDYNHFVRWTGTLWTFAAGDVGNKFFRDFAGTPQEGGWQLCDGTVSDFLVVGGAALTVTAFTTPNVTATPVYRKSAAAYTGALNAASGATANEAAHTHAKGTLAMGFPNSNLGADINYDALVLGFGTDVHSHTISGDTAAGSAHGHGVGSIDMANLGVLPYFRR